MDHFFENIIWRCCTLDLPCPANDNGLFAHITPLSILDFLDLHKPVID